MFLPPLQLWLALYHHLVQQGTRRDLPRGLQLGRHFLFLICRRGKSCPAPFSLPLRMIQILELVKRESQSIAQSHVVIMQLPSTPSFSTNGFHQFIISSSIQSSTSERYSASDMTVFTYTQVYLVITCGKTGDNGRF